MQESEIRNYAALMKELDLTGLEITDGAKVVRMERAASGTVPAQMPLLTPVQQISEEKKSLPENSSAGQVPVTSHIIGVFYAAPSASAPPFVRESDHVKKGQTLCIVEAMKLMNEIEAPADGVIEKIYVSDGQTVEFGTKLFLIRED